MRGKHARREGGASVNTALVAIDFHAKRYLAQGDRDIDILVISDNGSGGRAGSAIGRIIRWHENLGG